MESPFFRSHWGYPHRRPRYDPSGREIHVQRQPNASPFRVVNVPVRFVGSERSRSDSALKIQKVLRGFLVRKSVRKIMAMRREVDEIEKRLLKKEVVELIRSNAKEKLKVNETLMNLLLNLDSVRGLDSGVRDCRKTVIKKVIGLQEKVDAIVAGERAVIVTNSVPADDNSAEIIFSENVVNDSADFVDSEQQRDQIVSKTKDNCDFAANRFKGHDNVEPMVFSLHSNETKMQEVGATCESPESHCGNLLQNAETNSKLKRSGSGESMKSSITKLIGEAEETIESERRSELKSCEMSDDSVDAEMCAEHGLKYQGTGGAEEISDSRMETDVVSSKDVENGDQIPSENVSSTGKLQAVVQSREAEENNKELLERMADENVRMIGLIAELLEKNKTQTRLLKSLTQRVEHLEKSRACEKLRKKKKRNAASAPDCADKRRETKKSG